MTEGVHQQTVSPIGDAFEFSEKRGKFVRRFGACSDELDRCDCRRTDEMGPTALGEKPERVGTVGGNSPLELLQTDRQSDAMLISEEFAQAACLEASQGLLVAADLLGEGEFGGDLIECVHQFRGDLIGRRFRRQILEVHTVAIAQLIRLLDSLVDDQGRVPPPIRSYRRPPCGPRNSGACTRSRKSQDEAVAFANPKASHRRAVSDDGGGNHQMSHRVHAIGQQRVNR